MDIQERPFAVAIRTLKGKIKALAELQVKCRLARKTKHGDLVLRDRMLAELGAGSPGAARNEAVWRKSEITAHLNLYLELRGKAYRHNTPEGSYLKREYERRLLALRAGLVV